jgi:methionine-rich copper-binding protein CopC
MAGLAAAALVALAAGERAESHAVLVRSAPVARAVVLTDAPARVQLWFSEGLEPAFSGLSVWSKAGAQVDRRDAGVGPDDPRMLSVTLPPIEPGLYTVRYRVLSVDGHVAEGSFTFTVASSRSRPTGSSDTPRGRSAR